MVSSGVRALPRTAPQLCPAHHTALCNAGLSGWVSPADLESPPKDESQALDPVDSAQG